MLAGDASLGGQSKDALGARVDRLVDRVTEARQPGARCANSGQCLADRGATVALRSP